MSLRVSAPQNSSATVIFFHGLGDTGHGWSFLPPKAHERPDLQHVNFVLPHAPNRFFPIFNRSQPGWFDLPRENTEKYINGMLATLDTAKSFINAEIERGIDPSRIVVAGFSQGGAVAQCLATTYTDHKLGGFVSLSGYMPVPETLLKMRSDKNVDTPFFLAHGTKDPILSYDVEFKHSEHQLLDNFGFTKLEPHTYDGLDHSVSLQELEDFFAFLDKVIPAKQ